MPINPPPPYTPAIASAVPHPDAAQDAHARWLAHVDAGRIGSRPPADPEILANHARVAAIFGHPPPVRRG